MAFVRRSLPIATPIQGPVRRLSIQRMLESFEPTPRGYLQAHQQPLCSATKASAILPALH